MRCLGIAGVRVACPGIVPKAYVDASRAQQEVDDRLADALAKR